MADAKISQLPAGTANTGGPLPTVQAGVTVQIQMTPVGATIAEALSAAAQRTAMGSAASGAVTASGLTQTTARLLGRTTAATGAIEEIAVGSGLSLSAGSLIATGGGTVTSVDVSGGTTGLTFSGGPITSSGTITMAGTLAIASGGTGAATLAAAGIVTGSGTSGQVSFWNGTATQASDTNFLWDNTNKQITVPTVTVASANTGTLMLGSGGFAGGGAPNFSGSSSGTSLAFNVASTFAGNIIDCQQVGAISLFKVRCVSGAGSGLSVEPQIAGSGIVLKTLSTGTNELLTIESKGTGAINLKPGGGQRFSFLATQLLVTPSAQSAGALTTWSFTAAADTTITLSTEKIDFLIDGTATKQWATGALAINRDNVIVARTHRFVGASTETTAVCFNVTASPNAGTNATLTTSVAAAFGATNTAGVLTASVLAAGVTNSRSLEVYVQTGATRNIALRLPSAPQANASVANLAVGSGPFDGTTATFFVGSANGTQIGINAATGYTGNLIDAQLAGVSQFSVTSAGAMALTGSITMADATNIIVNATTGTKIATATSQKLGFWNTAPIVQPTAAHQAALTNSTGGTYDGTLIDVGVVFSQANINNNFTDVFELLNEVRTALVNSGLIKGS